MADVAIKSNAYAEQTDTSLVLVSHLSANQLGTFNFGQSNYFKDALPRVRPIRTWRLRIGAFTGRRGNRLKLVKQIAELHGGRAIAASDGPDHGATFTVTLPRIAVRQVQQLERDAKSNDPAGPRRILIIEDNDDARESLRALLEELGHEINEVVDGPAGVEKRSSTRGGPVFQVRRVGFPPGVSGL